MPSSIYNEVDRFTNERHSTTIGTIGLPRLARALLTLIGSCRIYSIFQIKAGSYPSVSLRSWRVSITFRNVGSFFIACIHCKNSKNTFLNSFLYTGSKAFSALMRATSGESPFCSYSLIRASSWASWRLQTSF